MSRRRLPIGALLIAPVVAGFGVYAFTAQAETPEPEATPTPTTGFDPSPPAGESTPVSPPAAGSTPVSPPVAWTPTPDPSIAEQRGNLREGAWVRVNAGEGDCLNARNQPSLESEWVIVNNCLPHGFEGYISGSAQQADGHWWWFLAGMGWVAEDYLEYVGDVDIRARTLPELSGRGAIAFMRRNEQSWPALWIMNADGSGQRLLRPAVEGEWFYNLAWTPDGSALTFSASEPDGGWAVHILPVDDPAAEVVIPNAFGVAFAPDSQRFGSILEPQVDGMAGGAKGIPAIIDVRTGERQVLSAAQFWQQAPPAFNHDGTLLLVTYANYDEGDAGRPRILVWDLAGNEVVRIDPPRDGYYASPSWSPVDNRIEFHAGSAQGEPQYVLYDLERRDIVATARVPAASDKIGGRCGSWNMWSAEWSRDGGSLLYSFEMGDTGANGIWRWDLATGERSLVPAASASGASAGRNGYATFASGGYIFIASPAGGFPTILTDGESPVWSP